MHDKKFISFLLSATSDNETTRIASAIKKGVADTKMYLSMLQRLSPVFLVMAVLLAVFEFFNIRNRIRGYNKKNRKKISFRKPRNIPPDIKRDIIIFVSLIVLLLIIGVVMFLLKPIYDISLNWWICC